MTQPSQPDKSATGNPDRYPRVTLSAVVRGLQQSIRDRFEGQRMWVRAEIAQISQSRSGHHFLELIESGSDPLREGETRTIAKVRAMIWRNEAELLRKKYGTDLDPVLKQGSQSVFLVRVDFDMVYGLGIQIEDIDLEYHIGQLEKMKRETLAWLRKEDLLHRNSRLALARVPQRIALVGAPGTAGFTDFVHQLGQNPEGYRFGLIVFPTRVQGEGAAAEMIQALKNIDQESFDAVVLIRGGGSRMDLDLYNDRALAQTIALFSIPVLSGIGHETDRVVADEVAHTAMKTPTAVAEFLLEKFRLFESGVLVDWEMIRDGAKLQLERADQVLKQAERNFPHYVSKSTGEAHTGLQKLTTRLVHSTSILVGNARSRDLPRWERMLNTESQTLLQQSRQKLLIAYKGISRTSSHRTTVEEPARLSNILRTLRMLARHRLRQPHEHLDHIQRAVRLLDPRKILGKGYAIPRLKGKLVLPDEVLKPGDELTIEMATRMITTEVTDVREERQRK